MRRRDCVRRTDLLASLISAMAMRILFLRKMRSRMMTTSTMARMITGGGAEGRIRTTQGRFNVLMLTQGANANTRLYANKQTEGLIGVV